LPRVLVVDDDPLVCGAIEACLQRQGFEITVADGGEAGLHALETAAFDVMLIDVFTPHMRGYESIRVFHERAPTIPLIAMSGYAFANLATPTHDFLAMTLQYGATRSLRKPFRPNTLVAVVTECLINPSRAVGRP
jgi:CheY-like chemotaxis protein